MEIFLKLKSFFIQLMYTEKEEETILFYDKK